MISDIYLANCLSIINDIWYLRRFFHYFTQLFLPATLILAVSYLSLYTLPIIEVSPFYILYEIRSLNLLPNLPETNLAVPLEADVDGDHEHHSPHHSHPLCVQVCWQRKNLTLAWCETQWRATSGLHHLHGLVVLPDPLLPLLRSLRVHPGPGDLRWTQGRDPSLDNPQLAEPDWKRERDYGQERRVLLQGLHWSTS